jgi:hypothetical protein
VQHERINVGAKLSDQKRDPVGHEATDEMNVSAETVQLRHGHLAPELLSRSQRGSKLWSAVKCISALASFDLNELTRYLKAFSLGEMGQGRALGFNSQA